MEIKNFTDNNIRLGEYPHTTGDNGDTGDQDSTQQGPRAVQITARQLEQLAHLCNVLNAAESNDGIYRNNPEEATLINSDLRVTCRETGRLLGHINSKSGSYRFEAHVRKVK